MTTAYKYAIAYFLAFSILLLISSILIFEHKIGLSAGAVLEYYLGNAEKFMPAKSYGGMLKIVLPHLFAFGLFSMVILHFIVFTSQREKTRTKVLIYLTFMMAMLEMITPFLIIAGFESFAYLKLFSFLAFELLIVYSIWVLFSSIVYV